MKRILIITALAVATVSFCSCAGSGEKETPSSTSGATSTARPRENIEQILKQIEREGADVWVNHDTTVWERNIAEDWIGIVENPTQGRR